MKKELEHVIVEVSQEACFEQSIWLILGSKEKIRIGIIYEPQECRTRKKQLEGMYDRMKEEINMARVNNEKIIIMGDFNCKAGRKIFEHKEEVKKGEKL